MSRVGEGCFENEPTQTWTAPQDGLVSITSRLQGSVTDSTSSIFVSGSWSFGGVRRLLDTGGVVAVRAGQTYTLAVDIDLCSALGDGVIGNGTVDATAEATFTASSASPPPNDNRIAAAPINSLSGNVSVSMDAATTESSDPYANGARSTWYRFQPAMPRLLSLRLIGGAGTSELKLFEAGPADALNTVPQLEPGVGPANAQSFRLRPGKSYLLLAAGAEAGSVSFSYLQSPITLPPNDDAARAQALAGTRGSFVASNVNATPEAADSGEIGPSTVWFRLALPTEGRFSMRVVRATFDAQIGIYTRGAGAPPQRELLASGTVTRPALSGVDVGLEMGIGPMPGVSLSVRQGTLYRLALAASENTDGGRIPNGTGRATIYWSFTPFNDVTPQVLFNLSGVTPASNGGATAEGGERPHWGNAARHSVWFSWRAPQTGTFSLRTSASAFNSVLAAYEGSQSSVLMTRDDNPTSPHAQITFPVVAGRTYFIALDSATANATGTCNLSYTFARPATPRNTIPSARGS